MPSYGYSPVALKHEVVEMIHLLAKEHMRSVPKIIEYLAKSELDRRLDKIKEKKNNLS